MDTRGLVNLIAIIALALGSTVLLLRLRETPPETQATPEIGIGYFVQDATLSGTGSDGRILYRISAATVVQSPGDGSVNLDEVRVDYEPAAEVPWSLRADTGRMHPDGKIMELSGNVVARTRDADDPVATITTDYLTFDTDTHTATTQSAVLVEYAGSVIRATGLRALLREDRLELLTDVRGRYVR